MMAEIRPILVVVFNVLFSVLVSKGILDQANKDQLSSSFADATVALLVGGVTILSSRHYFHFKKAQLEAAAQTTPEPQQLVVQAEQLTSSAE